MLADLRGLQLLNEIGVASCAAAAAWLRKTRRGMDLPLLPLRWTRITMGRSWVAHPEGFRGKPMMFRAFFGT